MNRNVKIPINRLNRYYDEDDFQLDLDMAREVIEDDMNFKIVLFRIDRDETDTDDLYGETPQGDVNYLPPIEVFCIVNLYEPENKSYNPNGTVRYREYGNLHFTVLQQHLTELGVDIEYGDIIGYTDHELNIKYFTVSDDGRIFSDNKHTRYGYKGFYRNIKCVTVDPNEFNGI